MGARRVTTAGTARVLPLLAASQFLMALDSTVMNVSLATVAEDLGTTITGVQAAITLYTLVMATMMITGGKLGSLMGRRRAFAIGTILYAAGSLLTALAPNVPVLLVGWSLTQGLGAALILPAVVALVAVNVPAERRPAAYGLIAAAGAIAVAAGPLIGGAVTTYASWRYVFAGEVLIALAILVGLRGVRDSSERATGRLDLVGSVLTVAGLGACVFGVLRSSEWGWINPPAGAPSLLGLSPVLWLLVCGMGVLFAFVQWERHVEAAGREPLVRLDLFRNRRLTGGLSMFAAQFTVQAGVFFSLPLFLSIVLELDPLQTGVRLLPLSVSLLATAVLVPRLFRGRSPRRLVQSGVLIMLLGVVLLMAGMDPGAGAEVVAVPLLLVGAGLGFTASQLGAVTVSSVPESESAEVGGLQNTATNLGASLGTALIGSVLIATLSASVVSGIRSDPRVPESVRSAVDTELTGSVAFVSDSSLREALQATPLSAEATEAIVETNAEARLDALRTAFGLAALLLVGGMFLTPRLPHTISRADDPAPSGRAPPSGT